MDSARTIANPVDIRKKNQRICAKSLRARYRHLIAINVIYVTVGIPGDTCYHRQVAW